MTRHSFPGDPFPDLPKAMEAEHCHRSDSKKDFTTSNYKINTCSFNEWMITLECDVSKADMRHGRRLPDILKLLQMEITKLAKLSKMEVTAIILYTGPMVGHCVYVCICRHRRHLFVCLLQIQPPPLSFFSFAFFPSVKR